MSQPNTKTPRRGVHGERADLALAAPGHRQGVWEALQPGIGMGQLHGALALFGFVVFVFLSSLAFRLFLFFGFCFVFSMVLFGLVFVCSIYGCGSKLNRRGKQQVLVHVSSYQGFFTLSLLPVVVLVS